MPWQIGTEFPPYIATATTWQSGYEASWLPLLDNHPLLRTYRSANTSQTVITCRFPSLTLLKGILVQNTNAGKMQFARSTDGITYVDLNTGASALTTKSIGQHWQYRRYCQVLNVQATHIQITIPAQTPLDGAAWYEVGSILFPSFVAWPRSPRPGLRERITREYDRAGNSIARVSELRVEQEFTMVLQAGLEGALKTFAMLGEDEPFAIYEDNNNTAEALLMRRESALDFERHRPYRTVSNLRFRELV